MTYLLVHDIKMHVLRGVVKKEPESPVSGGNKSRWKSSEERKGLNIAEDLKGQCVCEAQTRCEKRPKT